MLIYSGLDGIEKQMECPEPVNLNLYTAPASLTDRLDKLPGSLDEAHEIARHSDFVKSHLPEKLIDILN